MTTVQPNPMFNFDIQEQERNYNKFVQHADTYKVNNFVDLFLAGMRVSSGRQCLGSRSGPTAPYTWQTYQEVFNEAYQVGCFLKSEIGLKRGEFVGIFSKNRPEWVIFELGCFMFSFVPVPLYDTLGKEACDYIVDQTKFKVILAENSTKACLIDGLSNAANVKHVIMIDNEKMANLSGKTIWDWRNVLTIGKQHPVAKEIPSGDDLAILCYTSGTTGNPKGSQMTHKNLAYTVIGVMEYMTQYSDRYNCSFNAEDVYISYLPLAHSMERVVQASIFFNGASIGFFRGDIRTLVNDIQELKPTIFVTVPRLLNRIYDKTLANAHSGCLKKMIFNAAMRSKGADIDKGIVRRDTIWDKIVFSKVQRQIGGRVRIMLTGSAPIAQTTLRFSRIAFGCPVMEGYGQTECTAGSTITIPGVNCLGSVGVPMPCNMVRLVDVPDMNYFTKNRQGEVQIKGSNVFTGYYNLPDQTKSTLTNDGWLQTGDIGQWSPEGYLQIIDRRKHLFKLAQGEYIAPEKIEQIYVTSRYVAQVFVEGNSTESYVVAIVIPDPEVVIPWARKNDLSQNMKELCESTQLKNLIQADIIAVGTAAGLKSFEQAKSIKLHHEQFSVENDLLTPTFKAKRQNLRVHFAEEVKRLYELGIQTTSSSND